MQLTCANYYWRDRTRDDSCLDIEHYTITCQWFGDDNIPALPIISLRHILLLPYTGLAPCRALTVQWSLGGGAVYALLKQTVGLHYLTFPFEAISAIALPRWIIKLAQLYLPDQSWQGQKLNLAMWRGDNINLSAGQNPNRLLQMCTKPILDVDCWSD